MPVFGYHLSASGTHLKRSIYPINRVLRLWQKVWRRRRLKLLVIVTGHHFCGSHTPQFTVNQLCSSPTFHMLCLFASLPADLDHRSFWELNETFETYMKLITCKHTHYICCQGVHNNLRMTQEFPREFPEVQAKNFWTTCKGSFGKISLQFYETKPKIPVLSSGNSMILMRLSWIDPAMERCLIFSQSQNHRYRRQIQINVCIFSDTLTTSHTYTHLSVWVIWSELLECQIQSHDKKSNTARETREILTCRLVYQAFLFLWWFSSCISACWTDKSNEQNSAKEYYMRSSRRCGNSQVEPHLPSTQF